MTAPDLSYGMQTLSCGMWDLTPGESGLVSRGSQGLRSPLRSEEHTSELQSHIGISYAVFCLKKNFFNDTATTEIYTLSLHDALPILYLDFCCPKGSGNELRIQKGYTPISATPWLATTCKRQAKEGQRETDSILGKLTSLTTPGDTVGRTDHGEGGSNTDFWSKTRAASRPEDDVNHLNFCIW